jgi:hypothetical protein
MFGEQKVHGLAVCVDGAIEIAPLPLDLDVCLVDVIPTVSSAKNSLVYLISRVYIDHLVWGSHREEAKRGPPSGHRITRNEGAMMSLLLP